MNGLDSLLQLFHGPKLFHFLGMHLSSISISCSLVLFLTWILYFTYERFDFITNLIDAFFILVLDISNKYLENQGVLFIGFLGFYIGLLNLISCFGFFAVTSYFPATFIMSFSVFFCSLIFGIWKKGFAGITDLSPKELPIILRIVFFPIELFSISLKPISLGARLFFNIAIGHFIKDVLWQVFKEENNPLFAVIVLIINLMEIFSGGLQAYLFMLFGSLLARSFITNEH